MQSRDKKEDDINGWNYANDLYTRIIVKSLTNTDRKKYLLPACVSYKMRVEPAPSS